MKIITIDGPAGSGKSTVAKILAEKLKFLYIDSGSLYRAFAYWSSLRNIENFENNAKNFDVQYDWKNGKAILFLEGEDITEKIRDEKISKLASNIATQKNVREVITTKQREIAATNDVVLEGRDSGTVVFPLAYKKFFLTASIDERASRRAMELKNKGEIVDFEKVKNDIKARDFKDENRDIAPLIKAKDALEIDTTGKTIEQIIEILVEKIR